jgi:phosphoribosylformylglycinamidine cyclo-ligase
VASAVGYVIEGLPAAPPIFSLIQTLGDVSDAEMFQVYNMGIGFCIIVQAEAAEHALSLLQAHGKRAHKIGHAVLDERRRVHIKDRGLIGERNQFFRA